MQNETETTRPRVTIYTDGGCEPNPGPGAYGIVLLHPKKRAEVKGGFRRTTNNRMEIYAAIKALELLKQPCIVTLYSDSKYVVDSITLGWAVKWKKRNWWRTNKERAENFDLWDRLLDLCGKHEVKFQWVRGHAGNAENECCDRLCCTALREPNLPPDEGYEHKTENGSGRPKPKEGEACWSCATAVIKRERRAKPGQDVFNAYFLQCPKCQAIYEVEESRTAVDKTPMML